MLPAFDGTDQRLDVVIEKLANVIDKLTEQNELLVSALEAFRNAAEQPSKVKKRT